MSAATALAIPAKLKEPLILEKWLLWLEQRPGELGRTTLLIRPWNKPELIAQELTPQPINVASHIHEYGGASFFAVLKENILITTWVDAQNNSLWCQHWQLNENNQISDWWQPLYDSKCLSIEGDFYLADGLIDFSRNRWVGVMERAGKDYFVIFELDKEKQNPKILHSPVDFAGYLSLSPCGRKLAWIEWAFPDMPWDASKLYVGELTDKGEILSENCLLGNTLINGEKISIFQPTWLPNGQLLFSEDSLGYWNLNLAKFPSADINFFQIKQLTLSKFEHGMPQWNYGLRTHCASGNKIISMICDNGLWKLYIYDLNGNCKEISQPFNDFKSLFATEKSLVVIASNSFTEYGLLEIELETTDWLHTTPRKPFLSKEQISVAEPFWFNGFNGRRTHAWYYPPLNLKSSSIPLLVKSHSGPTSMASNGLNLEIQFWTSRGWGVVDVNYGGSSGFGKSYRDRLKGQWGIVDVCDCAEAAKALIQSKKVDENKVAIEGGSAGGFTTLSCLCFTDIFSVGACRYSVSDLTSLAEETHRFEAGYLDSLVGKLPDCSNVYRERSPIYNAEKINCPIIFFQGMKDNVVSPKQSIKMVQSLRERNIPVEVHFFPEEGHGFRNKHTKIKVLNSTLNFFNQHLGI